MWEADRFDRSHADHACSLVSVDLERIRSFVAVAEAGAITDAARDLLISQSTLSRRLQQLERDLGAVLLTRSSSGVELTDAGRDVLVAGRQLLDRYEHMHHSLRARDDLEHGSVRVGGGATATSFLLPDCIARFHAAHPNLTFHVKEAGSRQVAHDVADGKLDLGIVTTPIGVEGIALQRLLVDHIALVAPAGHHLRGRPARPRDLDGLAIIGFEPGTAIRNVIDAALTAARVRVEVVAELRSIPTMLSMARQTGMAAFVSRLGIASDHELAEVTIPGLRITRELAVATRTSVPPTPAARAFIDTLHETASSPS